MQQFQIFQTSASNDEVATLVDNTSAVSVQPLDNRKELQDSVEPPIPKVRKLIFFLRIGIKPTVNIGIHVLFHPIIVNFCRCIGPCIHAFVWFQGPYTCQSCSKIFTKWGQLRRHQKTHDDDQPFKCNVCPAAYNVQENLTLHEAIHKHPRK